MDGATFLWHIYFLSLAGIDRYMSVNPATPKNGFLPMLLYILEMHWVIHTFLCQVYQWRRAVAADRRKAGESVSAPPPNRLFSLTFPAKSSASALAQIWAFGLLGVLAAFELFPS